MTSVHEVTRAARSGLVVLLAGVALTACQEPADLTVISVLAPDGTAALVREPGRTAFLERVAVRCPDCEVRIHSVGTSVQDLEGALEEGADVVVVEALTAAQGAELVAAAGAVPVVALDRFFAGADFFVSYDRASMGGVVAEAVADELDRSATALVVNGSTVDTDTDAVERGLRDGLDSGRVEVAAELDAATGTSEETRAWVEDRLEGRAGRDVGAIVTVSDEQALGVVDALQDARVPRPRWPLVTGAGADLAAVRRIITGDQSLTVHMPIARTAQRAADVALSLASENPGDDLRGATEVEGVPAYVYRPVLVDLAHVTDVVVRDGTFTTEELCAGPVADDCARLGIR